MPTRVAAPAHRTTRPARTRAASAAAGARRAACASAPQDRALYRCGCGHASVQPVSTTVACPVCGSAQDW